MNYYYLVITIFLFIVSIYIYYISNFSKRNNDFPIFNTNVIVPNPNNLLIWIQPKNTTDPTTWNHPPTFKPFGTTFSPSTNPDNSITFTDTSVTTFILEEILWYFPNFDMPIEVYIIIANLDGSSPISTSIGSYQTPTPSSSSSILPLQNNTFKPAFRFLIDPNKTISLQLKASKCDIQGCYLIDTIIGLIFQLQ